MRKLRPIALALAASLVTLPAVADEAAEMAISYRQGAFKMLLWNFMPLGKMVRGQATFDAEVFKDRSARVAWLSRQLLEGFPKGSGEGAVTDALPEIWANWDDFSAKMHDLEREAATLAQVAQGGDESAIKDQFQKVRETCGACHEDYRSE